MDPNVMNNMMSMFADPDLLQSMEKMMTNEKIHWLKGLGVDQGISILSAEGEPAKAKFMMIAADNCVGSFFRKLELGALQHLTSPVSTLERSCRGFRNPIFHGRRRERCRNKEPTVFKRIPS